MKRCPTCNRTFEEEWLAFCTQDGTTLVDDSPQIDPAQTIMAPPPPPVGGWKPPSSELGSGGFQQPGSGGFPQPPPASSPSGGFAPAQFQPPPQQMQGGWQPPPPPNYAQAPKQGFAIASMICGICTVTIGWCCYLGVLTGPVAIGLGIYQLIQIKNNPDQNTGKPLAIVGIATAAAYFVILAFIIVIYGAAIFMGGLK